MWSNLKMLLKWIWNDIKYDKGTASQAYGKYLLADSQLRRERKEKWELSSKLKEFKDGQVRIIRGRGISMSEFDWYSVWSHKKDLFKQVVEKLSESRLKNKKLEAELRIRTSKEPDEMRKIADDEIRRIRRIRSDVRKHDLRHIRALQDRMEAQKHELSELQRVNHEYNERLWRMGAELRESKARVKELENVA